MTLSWTKEARPRWDEDKDRVFTDADLAAVGLGSRPAVGDAIADEWWAVRSDDDVVGYGWLDSEWGDAQITFSVAAAHRGAGVGSYVVDCLADEARERGLSIIYNVVPATHPDPAVVTAWLEARGFADAGEGELRKKV
ncbi:GNAT family N-acetyltransferase [Jatrophihabitans sp. YIM 134969]